MPGRADAVDGKDETFLFKSLKSALWRGGLFAVGAFVIALLNPFDVTTWEEMRSHEVWERIQAPMVAGADRYGRDAITIVSINEETLAKTGFKRPFDMAMHGEILSDIVEAPRALAIDKNSSKRGSGRPPARQPDDPAKIPGSPKAVFIDLVLSTASAPDLDASVVARSLDERSHDERPKVCEAPSTTSGAAPQFTGPKSLLCYARTVAAYTNYSKWMDDRACQSDTLTKIACIQRHGGIPILFADETQGRKMGAKDTRLPAMRLLDEIAVTVPVFITLPEYPLIEQSEVRGSRRGPFVPPGDDERVRFTPATALYTAYCMAVGARTPECPKPPWLPVATPPAPVGDLHRSKNFIEPMDLLWATGGPSDHFYDVLRQLHPGAMAKGCSFDRGYGGAAKRFTERLFAGVHLGSIDPDCPYIHDLPYQDITAPDFGTQDAFDTLGGKLVLVGEEFHDSPDTINAAPNMALPGIYAHAMALDRLIAGRGGYRHPPRPLPSWLASWLDFNNVDVGIVLTVFVFFSLDRLLFLWIGFSRHPAGHGGPLEREAEDRTHWLWPWMRLLLRLLFPLATALAVWGLFRRQFEQSIVVVGGLAFCMVGEIAFASLVTWAVRRHARFVRLLRDTRRLFAPTPQAQAHHHHGEQP